MEADLLKNFVIDDELNLEKIVKTYSVYIYTIIKNMSRDLLTDEDIEELISDVLFVVWKNKEKIEENLSLKSYIAGITKNLTKNKLRTLKFTFEVIDNELQSNVNINNIIETQEEMAIIKKVLNFFGKDKKIFLLYYYNGMKAKDIGELLGITESNVNVRIHRMKNKIKKELRKRGYNYGE